MLAATVSPALPVSSAYIRQSGVSAEVLVALARILLMRHFCRSCSVSLAYRERAELEVWSEAWRAANSWTSSGVGAWDCRAWRTLFWASSSPILTRSSSLVSISCICRLSWASSLHWRHAQHYNSHLYYHSRDYFEHGLSNDIRLQPPHG